MNPNILKRFTVDDRRTSIADTLTDGNEVAIDLSASTVVFRAVNKATGVVKIASVAAVVDTPATAGNVHYDWGATDLDTAGEYWYWWIVTTGGKVEHFPGDGKKATLSIVAKV